MSRAEYRRNPFFLSSAGTMTVKPVPIRGDARFQEGV